MQVGEALKERAERIYKDYGNVMLETEGMTKVRRLIFLMKHTPYAVCMLPHDTLRTRHYALMYGACSSTARGRWWGGRRIGGPSTLRRL